MTQPDLPDWLTKVTAVTDQSLFAGALGAGALTPIIDVSQYTALLIMPVSQSIPAAGRLRVAWYDENNNGIASEGITWPTDAAGQGPAPFTVPVRYPKMQLANGAQALNNVTLWGTFRTVPGMRLGAPQTSVFFTDGGTAKAVNGVTDFGYVNSYGRHWLSFLSTGTVVQGTLVAAMTDTLGALQFVRLTDTVEAHNDAGILTVQKEVILPQNTWKLQFVCQVAGTNTVSVALVSAEQ